MIIEYYTELGEQLPHLFPKTIKAFEEYITEHSIPREQIMEHIVPFTDTLPVEQKTRRTYRSGLRRYIEAISIKYWQD